MTVSNITYDRSTASAPAATPRVEGLRRRAGDLVPPAERAVLGDVSLGVRGVFMGEPARCRGHRVPGVRRTAGHAAGRHASTTRTRPATAGVRSPFRQSTPPRAFARTATPPPSPALTRPPRPCVPGSPGRPRAASIGPSTGTHQPQQLRSHARRRARGPPRHVQGRTRPAPTSPSPAPSRASQGRRLLERPQLGRTSQAWPGAR